MKTHKLILVLAISLAAITAVMLPGCRQKTAQCPLCAREVHSHMQVIIKHHSIPLTTCCMACALTYQMQESKVQIVSANDYPTDQSVDPRKAHYVVDSDISPCIQDPNVQKVIREPHSSLYACYDRCSPGILAFTRKPEAEKFLREHGGHLVEFDQLKNWIPAGGHHHD